MHISEFMTTKLVTITSTETVARAARLIYAHKVRRLLVVDEGVLVGILGERAVAAALPSAATFLSSKEMSDTLSRVTIADVMHKDVVTVTPETSAESALALAQEKKIGCLPVVDDQDVPVGIVTTNDFIYRILNPLLGLEKPGIRLHIYDCGDAGQISQITGLIKQHKMELEVIHVDDSKISGKRDLIVQVVTNEPDPLINDLKKQGYKVELRKRKSWPPNDG